MNVVNILTDKLGIKLYTFFVDDKWSTFILSLTTSRTTSIKYSKYEIILTDQTKLISSSTWEYLPSYNTIAKKYQFSTFTEELFSQKYDNFGMKVLGSSCSEIAT